MPERIIFAARKTNTQRFMQYNEHQLAQLAATVAAGLARGADLLDPGAEKHKIRVAARDLAQVSLLVARHILVGAHCAALKVDELELLYDDADFL
ncbi:MAG TPA: hypothetical protein VHS76_17455 [Steroidobacteraceae bacterium]|nr:hypothetical protein [Steroidobacteraceae bacterium]